MVPYDFLGSNLTLWDNLFPTFSLMAMLTKDKIFQNIYTEN